LVLADGQPVKVVGITPAVRLVFARGTPFERAIQYRFLVLPGKGTHYNWLIAKNALLELGAYVDPVTSTFHYRVDPVDAARTHSVPVRSSMPISEADPADCLHTLHPIVATLRPAAARGTGNPSS
jgi:hypothetical protein